MEIKDFIEKVLAETGPKKKEINFEIYVDQYGRVTDHSKNKISFTIKRSRRLLFNFWRKK
jgi:hypothetical protein